MAAPPPPPATPTPTGGARLPPTGAPAALRRPKSAVRPPPATVQTFLERRRFRTWESDTHLDAARRWNVVLRYGLLRAVRTWYIAGLLVVAAIGMIIALAAMSYDALEGVTYGDDYLLGTALFAWVPAILLLLVGAPLFAEDVRFNAPLFYFSRPLRTIDYALGKFLNLFGLLAVTGLLPVVLNCLMILALGVHDVPTTSYGRELSAQEHADRRAQAVDTFGDAVFGAFVTITGWASTLFFAGAAMVLCSAYTKRAWHAAMAFVAILGSWSMLGIAMTQLVQGAFQNLFGPGGWIYLVLGMPIDHHFTPERFQDSQQYDGLAVAVLLAHVLLLGLGYLSLRLAERRLRRLEAIL